MLKSSYLLIYCFLFVAPLFTSSGRGTPSSDIPKNEELIDLISDDEDSPLPTVDKPPPPPDTSQPDQPVNLTSSQPSGKSQSASGLVESQLSSASLAATPAVGLSVPEAALSVLAGTLNQWGSNLSRLTDAMSMSHDQRSALDSNLADLTKTIEGWTSALSKDSEPKDIPQLVNPEAQSTTENSRPPSSLR